MTPRSFVCKADKGVTEFELRRVRGLPRCRDRDDRKFLELASRGNAEVLVTGDAALLDLAGRVAFAIERPAGLRERLG